MTTRRIFDVKRLGSAVYESRQTGTADVVVVVPLYNYAATIEDCLRSVVRQTIPRMSLIVVDDCSADDGADRAVDLLRRHTGRFVSVRVIRHKRNQGVSMARNSGIAWSDEPFLFMLDADNRIRPPALVRLLEAVRSSDAAFSYSQLRLFGDEKGLGVADIWDPVKFQLGNYIDTMAMIRREALQASDGYAVLADDHGLEDYDLWCRFASLGLEGVFLPEVLCDYRVHAESRTGLQTKALREAQMAEMALRHPALFNADPDD